MATSFDITEEDKFAMGRISPAKPISSEALKAFEKEKPPTIVGETEDKYIDLESPMAVMVKGQQEALNRAKEPTELQKKYEEMGLEYDYQKRKETGSVYKQSEESLGIENPTFVQRNKEAKKVVSLRDQLYQQAQAELGRLNALEVQVWSNPEFAGSSYGKNTMATIRNQQNMVKSLYEAEDAKLDGQFYDQLPEKDMEVANMLLSNGVTGKRMTYYTSNHGDIRDTINELLLAVPGDKKEEVTQRLLGDYVRDDQGNVVTNTLGEELRKGGDLVSLTPYGTYDFKVSPEAYKNGINGVLKEYKPQIQSFKDRQTELKAEISALEEAADSAKDEAESQLYNAEADNRKLELGRLVLGTTTQPTATTTKTETETTTITEEPVEDLNKIADEFVLRGVATRGKDGFLIANENENERVKIGINEFNSRLKARQTMTQSMEEDTGDLFGTIRRRTW